MKLSILTTLYKTGRYLDEFYRRAVAAAEQYTEPFEIVLVDDGSPDNALQLARQLQQLDSRVRVIELSRNFGHHKAILAGLGQCRGEYVYLLDSDLEEAPEWIAEFYPLCLEQGADCAIGVQKQRRGEAKKRLGGKLFYRLINWLSDVKVPVDVTMARLMKREYVQSLLLHQETEVFFSGLCVLTGYNQCFIEVDKHDKGQSSYRLFTSLRQAINAITSFSNKPLYIIFVLGVNISLFCGLASIWILVQKLFFTLEQGYAMLIVSIWGGVGVILISTGVLGIYLAKIYAEVKRRPTIIKKIHES